jgi:DNA-binding CsgD family transcriptional regulator
MADAVSAIIARLHVTSPEVKLHPGHRERNQRIHELYAKGMSQAEIGTTFGISGR